MKNLQKLIFYILTSFDRMKFSVQTRYYSKELRGKQRMGEYADYFSKAYLSVDKVEITTKLSEAHKLQTALDVDTDLRRTNVFDKEFHGAMYTWTRYEYKNHIIHFIIPHSGVVNYVPRLLLSRPNMKTQEKILTLTIGNNLYIKVNQFEIALDFVFHNKSMLEYVQELTQRLDNSTFVNWGRQSKSFNVYGTRYKVNTDKKNQEACTKPIKIYQKEVNGNDVLRYELRLNKSAAVGTLPYELTNDTIFKYIKFMQPNINLKYFNKLVNTLRKKGVDIVKFKRLSNFFIGSHKFTIQEKIIKLKALIKKMAPNYNPYRFINDCLVEDKELNTFIINNLYIKGQ